MRLRARGEEALGDLAQALLENPLFNQALTAALGAGERAAHAQRIGDGSAQHPVRIRARALEQRLRSLSNRLESLEDRLDDARDEVAALSARRRPPSRARARATSAPRCPGHAPRSSRDGIREIPRPGRPGGAARGDRAHPGGGRRAGPRGIGRAAPRARHPVARRGRAAWAHRPATSSPDAARTRARSWLVAAPKRAPGSRVEGRGPAMSWPSGSRLWSGDSPISRTRFGQPKA